MALAKMKPSPNRSHQAMLLEYPSPSSPVAGEWLPSSDRLEKETVPPAPLVPAPPAPPPLATPKGEKEAGAKRVLLLEDDASFREIMKEFLTETGYAVREVKSGIEGIKEVIAGDFAVVLCDMQMPGLPGDLFYRAVERTRPELCERFIFMTGHRGNTPANDFIKAASGHALLKPFHLDKLLEAIGEMERQRHMRQEASRANGTPAGPAPGRQSPDSWTASARPPAAKAQDGVSAGAKRVLLLEDDASFREVIKEFLTETGYTVREAQSGMEGIQEVLAGEFAVVLCDMQMPGLAGDLFYRAVERARPQLCERFIFMTGHRGDARANDFIRAASGHALLKPFHLDKLLEAIGEMERQRNLAPGTFPQRGPAALRPVPKWVSSSDAQPVTANRNAPSEPPAAMATEQRPAENSSAGENHPRLRLWMNAATVLATVAVMALAYAWYRHVEDRSGAVSHELNEAQTLWTVASESLEKARAAGAPVAKFTERAGQVTNESTRRRWSSALQRIVDCTSAGIQLQDIRVRQVGDDGDAWSLRIAARCAGTRLDADTFRCKIQQELQTIFDGPVKTRFEEMEEVPGAAGEPARGATVAFTMVAAISTQPLRPRPMLREEME